MRVATLLMEKLTLNFPNLGRDTYCLFASGLCHDKPPFVVPP
jgi:hypothetical protein